MNDPMSYWNSLRDALRGRRVVRLDWGDATWYGSEEVVHVLDTSHLNGEEFTRLLFGNEANDSGEVPR